ncbi:MAG: outer membrane protein assembly factor [Proteobacteria bacterium]|nr:outer membrane protein assembly factor [Pseudomonadota bacterium]MBS0547197.1 outer membrane protein assembly factor [Pseudomonadota bacterium]
MQRRIRPSWRGRLAAALTLAVLVTGDAYARTADIALTVIGDDRMTEELKTLAKNLDKDEPLSGDGLSLLQAAQARRARMVSALRSRGFYDSRVIATVAGQPIEDAAALDAIDAKPEAEKIDFVFNVATGPVYRVKSIDIDGPPSVVGYPALDRGKLGLLTDQPADAAVILATENQILDQVRQHGYALAEMPRREVVIDHATREAHVTYHVAPGPAATMGRVTFTGTEKVNTTYLQKRVPFKEGEPYTPDKVTAMRDRLTGLGVFSAVRIKPAQQLNAQGELPFEVEVKDRLPRTIGFGVSYETILGVGVNAYWQHRNLFGEAENLKLTAEVNHIGEGAFPADLGYSFKAEFLKPDWWLSGQDATASAQALREVLPAYTREAALLGVGLNRAFSPHLRASAGLTAEISQILKYGVTNYYRLVGIPLSATLNYADSDTDATKGYKLVGNITPYADLNHDNNLFAILKIVGTTYLNVSGDGRSVIAARAAFGSIPGGTNAFIPPDKLFYAGGGGSVRGFTYQSAGPRDAYNNPLGGASLVEGSVEFRQRIGKSFGVVAFVDAGSAYLTTLPNFGENMPRLGAGLGARYYTGFGPARLDLGIPLNKRDGDAPFGVYVSLGQAF